MGYGLGKDSPVQLELGKENYEALISRHGQWIRWRVATKCPCVKENSMQPDIHCKKCGGLGVFFSYQKNAIVSQTVMCRDNSGIIELDAEFIDCRLIKCYDNAGIIYDNAIKTGGFVVLNTPMLPVKGVYITAVMEQETLQTVKSTLAENIGSRYYRVIGLTSSRMKTEGLFHTAPGDIESIDSVTDMNGNEYKIDEYRQDCIYIEPVETEDEETGEMIEVDLPDTLYVKNVKYIQPFIFVILNQNLSKSDEQVMQDNNGDAVLTFPYTYDVAMDDVLTILSGTYTQKNIITKKDADYDVIPAYFVEEVVSCIGKDKEFIHGSDFILCGSNYIKWLCDDCPDDGEGYSITYKVFPTYKVVKSIPQIRTSENQRLPKKAIIKLYDTYGEKRGVNKKQ